MYRFTIVVCLVFLVFLIGVSLADIPKLINYQGMLTDDESNPLTGSYNLTFYIYDDTTGGNLEWSETQNGVQVENGLFNVVLGKQAALNIAFDESYWLAVKVGTETMPRVRFTSVGYAYRARWAQRSDTADYALSSSSGPGDYTWTFRITDTADTTISTGGRWGITRYGNILYGNMDSTHVNLGLSSTTGISGQNYDFCTVGGGVRNTAGGHGATVGGGRDNTASGSDATVGGGYNNVASTGLSVVGGGRDNTTGGACATVGGGSHNTVSTDYATIAGGYYNTANGEKATVGGGYYNTADTNYATVGGGRSNTVGGVYGIVGAGFHNTASGYCATVGGGSYNNANTDYATVAGGFQNTVNGERATVGGGRNNTADSSYATVGGGRSNTASGCYTTVAGGYYNTASGYYATVAGGYNNRAGGNYSFAAGSRAKANHVGAFVWADETGADFNSTASNQFLIRAAGGVGIGTNSPEEMLHVQSTAECVIKVGTPTTNGNATIIFEEGNADALALRYDGTANELRIDDETTDNTRMVIERSGKVGIGTMTPGAKLAVKGLAGTSSYTWLKVNTTTGDFYYSSSSKRYKEDIQPLEDDFDRILQAEPRSFIDRASKQREIGYVAEEFDEMGLSNLVIYNGEGQPDGLKYELVSLYLLEVMKDQVQMLEELKTENEKLKQRIEDLEGR
jgi:hypothetical protein